jgi:hypothetical protein
MDLGRYEEWVKRSFRFIRDPDRDQGLPHHIQLLGIVDADLRGIRKKDLIDASGRQTEDENGILIQERALIYAHLWVLGAYEFIRMIAQRINEDPKLVEASSIPVINETKLLFTRIRIPLAKLEPASKHGDTDYAVPLPGIGPKGIGWRLNETLIVYQEELSDAFLRMLSSIRPVRNEI